MKIITDKNHFKVGWEQMSKESNLKTGSLLMTIAGIGFIGYAAIFFVRNFTDSFLELGITSAQVNVGKTEIIAFSQTLYNYR